MHVPCQLHTHTTKSSSFLFQTRVPRHRALRQVDSRGCAFSCFSSADGSSVPRMTSQIGACTCAPAAVANHNASEPRPHQESIFCSSSFQREPSVAQRTHGVFFLGFVGRGGGESDSARVAAYRNIWRGIPQPNPTQPACCRSSPRRCRSFYHAWQGDG